MAKTQYNADSITVLEGLAGSPQAARHVYRRRRHQGTEPSDLMRS